MKKAQPKPSTVAKHNRELLALLESRNSGAKLSLFGDWAAGRDPVEVQMALSSLDLDRLSIPAVESSSTRPKAKLYIFPRRSS